MISKQILCLNLQIKQCTNCSLHQNRNNTVPGEGNIESNIMFIGEGPGYHEDKSGRPFVGISGQFLDDLLLGIGLSKEKVFLTNILKCRTPQNRDPLQSEIISCNKYLDEQIKLINPRLIVTLGRFSTAKFISFKRISDIRGKLIWKDNRYIYPIMHPAAALHNPNLKDNIIKDFRKIPDILKMNPMINIISDNQGEQIRLL